MSLYDRTMAEGMDPEAAAWRRAALSPRGRSPLSRKASAKLKEIKSELPRLKALVKGDPSSVRTVDYIKRLVAELEKELN